jgi:hypothetical protein
LEWCRGESFVAVSGTLPGEDASPCELEDVPQLGVGLAAWHVIRWGRGDFVDYQGYQSFPGASKCLVSLNSLILPPSPSMIFAATKAAEINHNGDKQNQ